MTDDPTPGPPPPAVRPGIPDFGSRIGLLGDAHGNLQFLQAGLHALAERGVDSIVQLVDFGVVWSGRDMDRHDLAVLNTGLRLVDRHLYVVLGNHEGYTALEAIPADADGVRRLGRIWILPRAGRATAAGHPVGWLSGPASVDRSRRDAGTAWWPEELPSPAAAAALTDGDPVEIVFAHNALDTQALAERLAPTAGFWHPADLAYAETARTEFTRRVLSVLTDDGLVVSGHYHLRLTAAATLTRPDGTPVTARNEILSCEFAGDSVAVLDVTTRTIESFALDQRPIGQDWRTLRARLNQIPDGPRRLQDQYGLSRRELEQVRNGILLTPPALLATMQAWADGPEGEP